MRLCFKLFERGRDFKTVKRNDTDTSACLFKMLLDLVKATTFQRMTKLFGC